MTCIVSVVHKGKVYMGADSAGVSGYNITLRNDRKLFKTGEFLIGFTSSFRMGQLLGYNLSVPPRHPDKDIMEYMVTDFIEATRDTLRDGGYTNIENAKETGGQFLVGYAGRLFTIHEDFQVGESSCLYDACGCGEPYALGSLRNSATLTPHKRLEQALETAEFFSAGVAGPFIYEEI